MNSPSTNSVKMDTVIQESQAPSVRHGAPNNNASVANNNGSCMADAVAGPVRQEQAPAGVVPALAHQQQQEQQQEMSSSSSSSGGRGQQLAQGHQPRHFGVAPRIVTDVSSSNRTDSAVSNSNPNTSGSGSAGNSGNDNKGSSEDRVKEDNSGEGTNEGSDGAGSEGKKKIALGVDNILPEQPLQATSDETGIKGNNGPTRERKLIDKKRKRKEMRREYEAQQQFESSASSESKEEHRLRPGKAVSMDEVLFLSKIPR
jgi:hypothetical protein